MKSFNEPDIEIDFNESRHIYTYGKDRLVGATTYIKKYLKPFNAVDISKDCERY